MSRDLRLVELRKARLTNSQIAILTRQLAVMMAAGLGISRSLETLAQSTVDPLHSGLLQRVHLRLIQGSYLSRALQEFPGVFSPLYVALIQVGEATGGLVCVLEKLADWLERDGDLLRRVATALIYPALVLLASLLLMATVFATVLPGFVHLMQESGAQVAWYSRLTMGLVQTLVSPVFWIVLLLLVVALAAVLHERLVSEVGRRQLYELGLQLPVVKDLLVYAALTRFCTAVAFMLEVGLDMLQSLRLGAAASGSPVLRLEIEHVAQGLIEGETLSRMLKHVSRTPPMLWQMTLVGEETARLPEIFGRLSDHFRSEVGYRTEALLALLEPVLITFLACMVGFTAVSVMVPLYGALANLG